ncbi:hypothetical protein ESCO_001787 [Escovopsis weberi]|uniref:Uncharacterized protein n=1 Tax=Escovopsis weberi TaxID=150374 RepID=A0A0M9VWV0_ESCWE|nr:hypothetical protein ESCO_001787 [Escovopsis weberi]
MAGIHGAGARLRRTFHYPNDSDDEDNDPPSAMDEQEQDRLIAHLARQNALRNEQFARALLLLPLCALLAYARPLLRPSTAVFALLGTTSLLIAAFLVHRLQPTETGLFLVDAWARGSGAVRKGKMRQGSSSFFPSRVGLSAGALPGDIRGGDRSPLETYLPYMNLALVVLLMLMGLVRPDTRGGGFGWVSMGNLPALIYSIIITAKVVMAGVDPERELMGLRYDYKGA